MPKFKAVFYKTERFEQLIDAKDEEEAREIAKLTSPCHGDLLEDYDFFQFELMDINKADEDGSW